MLHPNGLCYNAPSQWPLLQCSTPMASVTMLHPNGLCYNAPPQWPLLQCSTPMASVTMLHPCLRMAVFLQAHDDVIKWKHFPCYFPFVQGIHRSPVNSSHKGQWCFHWSGLKKWLSKQLRCWWFEMPSCSLLSGVPDYFGRNKISSGGDLSHYSSASLY